MQVKLIFLSLMLLIMLSCNNNNKSSYNSSDDITKDEIIEFIKAYDAAWNSKKSTVVDSMYASQYKYFTSVGGVSSRARNLEILAADYYKLSGASRTEIEIFIDGNIAIVSSRWQGNGMWRGESFNDNQRCGLVIQKKGMQLQLLSEHCVDIATEPSF